MSLNLSNKQKLRPQDYLDLWKYFSDDAAKIKDRMWTIASLFFAAIVGLIGFMTKSFSNINHGNFFRSKDLLAIIILSVALWGLCYYFKYLMIQYGKHIRSGWNRSNFIRMQIEGLSEIWHLGNAEDIKSES